MPHPHTERFDVPVAGHHVSAPHGPAALSRRDARGLRRLAGRARPRLTDWSRYPGGVPPPIAGAATAPVVVHQDNRAPDLAAYTTTASLTFTAGKVYVAIVTSAGAVATAPTLSGGGSTWTQIDTIALLAGNRRITALRYAPAATHSTTIVVDFGGLTQSNCLYGFYELDTDAGGTNGSNAIVQSATAKDDTGSNAMTVTLGAAGSANNGILAGFGNNASANASTPEAGWTELIDFRATGENTRLVTQYRTSTSDLTPLGTSSGGPVWVGLAIEYKYPTRSGDAAISQASTITASGAKGVSAIVSSSVAARASTTLIAKDTFSRAEGALGGTSTEGAGALSWSTTGVVGIGTIGAELGVALDDDADSVAFIAAGADAIRARAWVTTPPHIGDLWYQGVTLRFTNGAKYLYGAMKHLGGFDDRLLVIGKMDGGVRTELAVSGAGQWTTGGAHVLELRLVSGATLELYVDDVLELTYSLTGAEQTNYATGGFAGLVGFGVASLATRPLWSEVEYHRFTGGRKDAAGAGAITQASTITASGTAARAAAAAITQPATIAGDATTQRSGTAAISSSTVVTATGEARLAGEVLLASSPVLTETGAKGGTGVGEVSSATGITAAGRKGARSSAAIGQGSALAAAGVGEIVRVGTAAIVTSSSATATGRKASSSAVSLAAAAAVLATGERNVPYIPSPTSLIAIPSILRVRVVGGSTRLASLGGPNRVEVVNA